MVSCGHLQVGVVITDQKLRVVLDDAEVEEKFAPGVIALCRSHKNHGNIMSKIIDTPQKHLVILLRCHVEILAIEDEGCGKLVAIAKRELIVVGKFLEFLFADSPRLHGRHPVLSSKLPKRKPIQMIGEDGLGIDKARIYRKMFATGSTEVPKHLLSASEANDTIRTGTGGAFVFFHMPHLYVL